MSNFEEWEVDIDEDESESVKDVDWGGRDGVVFLVDATQNMFMEDRPSSGSSETFIHKALRCCFLTMLKKAMGSTKDLIALVFFGTAQKKNHLHINNLYIVQELQEVDIERMKSLNEMIKSDSLGNFTNTYGHSNDYSLHDALWLCQSIFSNCTHQMGTQRILLFTANDSPHADNSIERQRALDRANYLKDLHIDLDLLPFGADFNVNLFYKELVETAMGEEYAAEALGRCAENLEELLVRAGRYSHKKRSQGRLLLHLGPDVAIGVGIYNLLRHNTMPKEMWLDKCTNVPLTPATHYFNSETGEVVLSSDILHHVKYAKTDIYFRREELESTRNILERNFYLLGFESKKKFKLRHFSSTALFMFPDESQVKGSRKLFAALLKRCSERGKVISCWGVLRSGGQAQPFILEPQLEVLNEDTGVQEVPGGFHVHPFYFKDNVHSIDLEEERSLPNPEELTFMNSLISKLTFQYKVHGFQDPHVQTLCAGIEALALEMESPREVVDDTQPKLDVIDAKLSEIEPPYEEVFPSSFSKETKAGVKRAVSNANENKMKALKTDEDVDMEEMARLGKVENLKVEQLKAFLRNKGRKVTRMKKSDLIDMVYEEFNIQ